MQETYDEFTDMYVQVWDENLHVGYWDESSGETSVAEATERLTDELIARLHCAPGGRVLDVGCGIGKPAMRLAQALQVEVVGISISRPQVDRANAAAYAAGLADRVSFQHADAMALPFPDASFDAVWAMESLHHMPDRPRALREIARVLRPGGCLALADFVLHRPARGGRKAVVDAFREMGGVLSLTTIDEYEAELRQVGFEAVAATDVSEQTRPSMTKHAEAFRARREELAPYLGTEVLDQIITLNEQLGMTPEIGYVLVSAHRP
ncbi:SAM-dependent methyltransferase [Carbonactinospora thermoautotrophica]|uniref:SAM-dependent methyltransferase n=1 Tax=Carbonactinospora thermoautotrophica TaxID=1469144 RepID=UPI0022B7F81A|nr:methyltransferase domain-containing protein [Carbonactinospora thermoautotrophica]